MDLQQSFQVAGVDGCKAGWFVAIASAMNESGRTDTPCVFELKRFLVAGTFAEVLSETSDCQLACVDIPIGLSTGKKLTKQTFALMKKIREVDDLMTPELQNRVREIHPEILFWALNGQKPIESNKKTVPGQAQRHNLLQRIFTDIDSILVRAPVSGCAMDDALDAVVAAWAAGQAVIGKAKTLPEEPQLDSKGLKMEMLYPACYNQ